MIDEKKLIEELEMEHGFTEDVSYFSRGIKRDLSEAITIVKCQPKVGEWIPCSERLPEEVGSYLVTVQHIGEYKYLGISAYFGNGMWAWENDKAEVIAWQPLLEPFCE